MIYGSRRAAVAARAHPTIYPILPPLRPRHYYGVTMELHGSSMARDTPSDQCMPTRRACWYACAHRWPRHAATQQPAPLAYYPCLRPGLTHSLDIDAMCLSRRVGSWHRATRGLGGRPVGAMDAIVARPADGISHLAAIIINYTSRTRAAARRRRRATADAAVTGVSSQVLAESCDPILVARSECGPRAG